VSSLPTLLFGGPCFAPDCSPAPKGPSKGSILLPGLITKSILLGWGTAARALR